MRLKSLCRRAAPFLLAGLWYALIFCLSAQTGSNSGALSDSLAYRLLHAVWPGFFLISEAQRTTIWTCVTFCLRKTAHMGAYFVLAALVLHAVRNWPAPKWPALWTAAACAALAALDELHQTFVPGRCGQLRDIFIDLAGAACFLLLHALWRRHKRN